MSADSTLLDGDDSRFTMLYCDDVTCRVNTFERGRSGKCPGCESDGLPLPEVSRG